MAVRSKRLWSGSATAVANTNVLVYTVPSGETALVKTLIVHNQSASTSVLQVRQGTGTANVMYLQSLEAGEHRIVELWVVVPETTPINIQSTVAGVRCQGYGTELEGVAD